MKRKCCVLTLAVVLLLAFSATALAWTSETEERPFRFSSGGAAGYYVWQDSHGFHLWVLPGAGSHTFMGTIRTDGRFSDVRGHHLDGGESFQSYPEIKHKYWFENLHPASVERFVFAGLETECGANNIFFKLSTSSGSDGLHFDVAGATYVGFELLMDGHAAGRKQIWYGGSSWHPETHIFKFENK